ncbi:chaperone modulator CbpM [Spirosoma utsteinense]|uniref:MerR family transcriptional regulator n=1 Tax=Spirosoma utsteinense TaxID=2585773 RepID=A0ABR6WAJ4_9BACT|nr:chaperone modulator CbpM [Spirosoma utsteinense]MBC3783883.1 hypothetical protein [Spirosoma utsteinense]MBC3793538.1 hypothetical protein [Spirosoma utsteinense]
MQPQHLTLVRDFCVYHNVEITFVETLVSQDLIVTTTIEDSLYVETGQLPQLEKLVRLHQELDIHPDDLDVVSDLLDKLENLKSEVVSLQNRLRFYEG